MDPLGGGEDGREREVRRQRDRLTSAGHVDELDADTAILEYVLRAAMQSLDPRETAALILHDAFPNDSGIVATCVGCSEGDLPGLLASARRRLRRERVATITKPVEALRRLRSTWIEGDRGALAELLSSDVGLFTVGGPESGCLRLPVHGSREVAQLLTDVMGSEPPAPELTLVDRVPWLIGQRDGLTVGFRAAEVHRGSVRQVWLVDGQGQLGRS